MEENKTKSLNAYKICVAFPIIVCIFHLIFEIIFQTTCNLSEKQVVTGSTFGGMFSISAFISFMTFKSSTLTNIKSISGVTNLVLALPLIFIPTIANKKKKNYLLICNIYYLIDTLFLIPLLIMTSINKSNYIFTISDYCLSIILHVLFLLLLTIGSVVEFKSKDKNLINKDDVLYMENKYE